MKLIMLSVFMNTILIVHSVHANDRNEGGFSNWSISRGCYNFIVSILQPGKTILELGSGPVTGLFSRYYNVYSVEHNLHWLNKYQTNYIYAPIKDGWYDRATLERELPESYDLILVDGPPEVIGRQDFIKHLDLFDPTVLIIIDDANRTVEHELVFQVANALGRKYSIYTSDSCDGKMFGVIFPKGRAEQRY